MTAPLLIADTPWLLYRSFFALPRSITDGGGRPVNALLGTVNAILSVIERPGVERPRAVCCCMGAEQADYRVALYPPYHAHRDPMPTELADQWERAPALLESLGWQVPASAELEADDLMFSLARAESQAGGRALLLTGDRDLFGAVDENVAVVELGRGGAIGELGPEEVREPLRGRPRSGGRFHRAAGRPVRRAAGRPGNRGQDGRRAAARVRLPRGGPARGRAARRGGAFQDAPAHRRSRCARTRTCCAIFREIATLQTLDLGRPPDRATDFAGGARAAAEMGMRRLSERLQRLARE